MKRTRKSSVTLQHLVNWSKASTNMVKSKLLKPIGDVWMDSRKISKGDIFLALKSETDDGHHYVPAALKAGALAAIVSRKQVNTYSESVRKKLIMVTDPLKAVQKMAAQYLKMLKIPTITITGSSGKTTTRQFITNVLLKEFNVGKTEGNWNNHIGVPLSVLRFKGEEEIAILEFGANHKNEINTLSRIVKPHVSIISNIGYAHIGYFGSLHAIADAKFEIVNGMSEKNGLLLVNGDDLRLVKKSKEFKGNVLFFGMSSRCDIRAENIKVALNEETSFYMRNYKYTLPMLGRHFVYGALPAIFLARQLSIPEKVIADALRNFKVDPMRGRIITQRGYTFIVDCYNANPSSMKAGINLLSEVSKKDKRCAIVGDMMELGKYSKRLHAQIGRQLVNAHVKKIIAVGNFAESIAEGAVKQGMKPKYIQCVEDAKAATACAKKSLKKGDTVLLKASRAVKLEHVVENFTEQ